MLDSCRWIFVFALIWAMMPWPRAGAQEHARPKPTPTDLASLLAGIENPSFVYDTYLACPSPHDPEVDFLERLRIEKTPHGMQIDFRSAYPGYAGFGTSETQLYDRHGKLRSVYFREDLNPRYFIERTGNVYGDSLFLAMRVHNSDEPRNKTATDKQIPVEPGQGAIPWFWQTLAIGYHLRLGHESFIIRLRGYTGQRSIKTMTVVNIGTETMQINGRRQQVHVLAVRYGYTNFGEHKELLDEIQAQRTNSHYHLRCLPTGQIVQRISHDLDSEEPETYNYKTLSPDQVRERFGEDAMRRLAVDPDPGMRELEDEQ